MTFAVCSLSTGPDLSFVILENKILNMNKKLLNPWKSLKKSKKNLKKKKVKKSFRLIVVLWLTYAIFNQEIVKLFTVLEFFF